MNKRVRMSLVAAAVLLLAALGAQAQNTNSVSIPGAPLRIIVAADGSFQIFNNAVPGVGQIFPTGGTPADMGIFAWVNGSLYAPDFRSHSGGTATGAGLTTYTPWQQLSMSPRVVGDGSNGNPYAVSVTLGAASTDLRVNMTVTYTNGANFFRIRSNFYSASGAAYDVDMVLAADIFLAGSDNGYFVSVPELNAVGGRNCDALEGDYNILLIPITPASSFSAAHYARIWQEIQEHQLDNNASGTECIDDGAAVQWDNILGASSSVAIDSAVSFGEIPSAANFHGFLVDVTPDTLELQPGQSAEITITSQHNESLGFNAPIHFNAPNLPPGMSITFDQADVPAPGDGTITAHVSVDGTIFPQLYRSIGVWGSGGTETHAGYFAVDVLCSPPVILGISQPQSVSVPRGTSATLHVSPEGGGLFNYQWYNGHAPMIWSPISGSNGRDFVTPPINEMQQYWVRVSNPCGSANSLTATVTPQ